MTSTGLSEYCSRPTKEDELFLERLDSLMQKSLADIRAFSERELRPFEEVSSDPASLYFPSLMWSPCSALSTDKTDYCGVAC